MRLTFVVVPLAIVGVDDLREDNALTVGDLDLVFLVSSSFPTSLIGLIMSESSLASTLSCNTPNAVDPVAMAPS